MGLCSFILNVVLCEKEGSNPLNLSLQNFANHPKSLLQFSLLTLTCIPEFDFIGTRGFDRRHYDQPTFFALNCGKLCRFLTLEFRTYDVGIYWFCRALPKGSSCISPKS